MKSITQMRVGTNIKTEITELLCKEAQRHSFCLLFLSLFLLLSCILLDHYLIISRFQNVRQQIDFFL